MSFIEMLRAETTHAKQTMLRAYATEMWKRAFQYCYHPDKMYGVKNIDTDLSDIGEPSEEMFALLDMLADKTLTGNAARSAVEGFIADHGSLIGLICKKDMDCGISATTLNKVFGKGFIPQFKVQLALEVPVKQIRVPCIGQIKYDGVRVIALIKDNTVTFKTRNGKTFEYPALAEALLSMPIRKVMVDGELTAADGKMEMRTKISGIVNSAIQGTPITKDGIQFNVFDSMALEDFEKGLCAVRYDKRFEIANYLVQHIANKFQHLVQIAKVYNFETREQITEAFADVLSKGYEGLIIKRWDHHYQFKRSSAWIKLKDTKTVTLTCMGVNYGEAGTKYSNCIGALLMMGKCEGKDVTVDVGSGLKDADRMLPHTHYHGKKIDVLYNTVIQDSKTGLYSLFLPRFDPSGIVFRGDL